MKLDNTISPYVIFDKTLCTGCANCMKACPTLAIRIKGKKSIRLKGRCIGCGECIRVCKAGAVSAVTGTLNQINKERISVALVTPVLYAQFPGVMPEDILLALKSMGFQHTVDMSYFLEMFQYATEEFLVRNRDTRQAPRPLISPVCPVVTRLIAFRFPNLLPHVLPLLRPVDLMAREARQRIMQEYVISEDDLDLYYINPCPTKQGTVSPPPRQTGSFRSIALGINDIYADLLRQLEKIKETDHIPFADNRFDFEYCHTGNGPMWGVSGGEISDLDIENTLAVSGLSDTVTYLEKIEMGLFSNIEYIEFRTCREGCLGGAITAIDKYLAKSAVNRMIKMLGIGKRLSRQKVLRLYEKGRFLENRDPEKLIRLFGSGEEHMSIEAVQQVDSIMEHLQGRDCSACGAPNCRTFAEDVVKGEASMEVCFLLNTKLKEAAGKDREEE